MIEDLFTEFNYLVTLNKTCEYRIKGEIKVIIKPDNQMKPTKAIFLSFLLLSSISLWAKDYNASLFGIKSNGTTLNTTSI